MWLPGVYADIAAGDDTTCVIDAVTWTVLCVGDGASNNAVDGTSGIVQRTWTTVSQIPSAVGIVSGGSTNYAWSATGAGWAWGENDNNQLANGATTPGFAALSTLTGIMGIGAGADHACAWSATWTKCWGLNDNGQVGVGTWTTPVTSPMMIDLPGKAMKVDGGDAHTCGINTDGALYCWGDNWAGQLGLRDTVDRNKPTIPTLFGVEDVLADYATTCALVKGGKVYCFGLLSPLTTTFLSDLGGSGYVTEPVLIPAETFDCSSKPASRGAKKGKGKKAKVAAGLIGGVAGVAAIGMAIRYRRKKNYQALATTSASSLPAV
jgi:alpha-tubulin suppressor-like RCC1 family protein